MASIQSLGIGSGLLTTELVDDIIAAERKFTDLRIDAEKSALEAKVSAFGAVKSSLDGLRSAAGALSNAATLLSKSTTSSNANAVTATVTADAELGTHTVEVAALARAHTLASIRFDDLTTVVGDGTLDFRFGTTTFSGPNYDEFTENTAKAPGSVTIDTSNNTLVGIRDAINEADIGITAGIVNDGQGFLLTLTSNDTGLDNSMEIVVTEGATPGLSALAFNASESTPGTNMTQSVAAEDAVLLVDGIQITRETNTISEVIDGVTFNALGLNPGAPSVITITQDEQAVQEKLQAFVDAFNATKSLTDQLTAYDEEDEVGSILIGDSLLRGVRSQLRRVMGNNVTGLGGSVAALIDLGISTDQNNDYLLKFDSSKFSSALAANPDAVQGLLSTQASLDDSLIRFVSFQSSTEAGTYDIDVTRMASQGTHTGNSVAGLSGSTTIDDDNDEFIISVDGTTSGSIQLTQANYTDANALAEEIQNRINADLTLSALGKTVSVSYNSAETRFEITSSRFGSSSQIGIASVDTNTVAELGLFVDSGESSKGVDVAGRINGVEGDGTGQFLAIPSGPQPASPGLFRGASITGFDSPPRVIDATNNTFELTVDGVASGAVTLTEASYNTGDELAAEIQSQINAAATFVTAEVSVAVAYDSASKRFSVTSASTGSNSQVSFTDVPPASETALGFTVAAGTAGRDATTAADVAGGIQLQVLGGDVGARGQITFVRGVMNQVDRYLDSVLEFGGTLDNKMNSLEAQLDDLNTEAANHDKHIDVLEERLRTQFAAADALISTLNNTAKFLDLQLAALPGYTRKDD